MSPRKSVLQTRNQFRTGHYLHFGEGKELFAQVLKRGPDMIYILINYQETVMSFVVFMKRYSRILLIMLLHI